MPNQSGVISTVRAEMARRGLKQKDLAELIGMTQVALSDRLRGNTPLRVDDLFAIAAALEVEVVALLGAGQVSA